MWGSSFQLTADSFLGRLVQNDAVLLEPVDCDLLQGAVAKADPPVLEAELADGRLEVPEGPLAADRLVQLVLLLFFADRLAETLDQRELLVLELAGELDDLAGLAAFLESVLLVLDRLAFRRALDGRQLLIVHGDQLAGFLVEERVVVLADLGHFVNDVAE